MASYCNFSDAEFQKILNYFGVIFQSATPINGGMANSSFLINNNYVLTALNNHNLESARMLIKTMRYIEYNKISTPQPILSLSNDPLVTLDNLSFILKPYIPSDRKNLSENLKPYNIGYLLRKLHSIPTPSFIPRHGRRIPSNSLDILRDHSCDDLKLAISYASGPIFHDIFTKYPECLCHGDLMEDNILINEDNQLVPIDWETATIDSLILDVGISCVSAIKFDHNIKSYVESLVSGYNYYSLDLTIDLNDVLMATAYAAILLSFHRFVRQNITFPDPSKSMIYKELLDSTHKLVGDLI